MKEVIMNELGFLSEQDCQRIKNAMDGKSYLQFDVVWSNCTGNCTLIVRVEDENRPDKEVKGLFLGVLSHTFAEDEAKNFILSEYVITKQYHPDGIVAFEGDNGRRVYFYFGDADIVRQAVALRFEVPVAVTPEGWKVASFSKERMAEFLPICSEKGIEMYYSKKI